MQFALKEMDKETALEILEWRYEAPYDFYNNEISEESIDELLSGAYQAVWAKDRLFGFICAGPAAQVPKGRRAGAYPAGFIDIGLGMDPGRTGQGNGRQFFGFAAAKVQEEHPGLRLRLTVADFNKRAIHLYRQFGFIEAQRFSTDSADFVTMEQEG